jgi:HPt (histidine-containing phosphotransfer) domain-containing protein
MGSVLDKERLDELASLGDEDDKEWMRSLVEQYVMDSSQRIQELQESLAKNDANRIGQVAHALKGSSNNMGVVNLVAPTAALQSLGEIGSLEGVEQLIKEVIVGFAAAKVELQAMFPSEEVSK